MSGGGFFSLPIELLVHLSICCNWFQMSRGLRIGTQLTEGEVTVRLIKVGAGGGGGRIAGRDRGRREGGREAEGFEDGCGVYSLCLILIVTTTFSHID